MKILIVSQYFWPEPFKINDIAEFLQSRGHEVEVLTGLPSAPQGKYYSGYSFWGNTRIGVDAEIFGNGIKVHRARILSRGRNFLTLTLNCLTFIWAGKRLARKLAKRKFDLIFCNQLSPVSSISPARYLSQRCGTRLVTYVYDIWPESMYFLLGISRVPQPLDRLCRRYCKTLYSAADQLLITSPRMAPKLQAMGISSQRISYLPQAADILEVSNYDSGLAESLGIRPTDFVVTFAGNLGRAQSLDTLLASARRLQDVFATNDRVSKPAVVSKSPAPNKSKVKFLVIGDGTEKEKIAKQIVDQKLDNVQLIGWVEKDDLSRYFSITSAFVVLLNDNEVLNLTLPAKVQTYMTVGKPVLASTGNATPMNPSNSVNLPNPAVSDLSELARVIREADCGLVSPAGDSKTLTANILKMWQFPKSKLQKLGSNSRTYSREHFDQRKLYANLEQLLVKIAETKI